MGKRRFGERRYLDARAAAPSSPPALEIVTRPPKLVDLVEARRDPAREVGNLVATSTGTLHAIVRGTGPDVVLLHGVTDNAHTWRGVQEALEGVARTHAVDLPGHGLSDIPPAPLGARQMASWVAAYLDEVGVDRAVIVGWSLGGAVSLAFAADHPARVKGLVLESTAALAFPFPKALWPLKVNGIAELMFRIGAFPGPRRFFMSTTFDRRFEPPEDVLERYWRDWQIKGRARYVRDLLRAFESTAISSLLGGISAPAWIVHGEEDRIVPARVGRELARLLPKADLRALAGVGHAPHVERPEVVLGAVRDALSMA